MLRSRNLDRTSRDSLSSEYFSEQSLDDLTLLNRFNTLLCSVNLPKLTNILDATPSLLIALYESIPPFQRVPYVDASAVGFGARLRNMKLLVGSIASGKYGLLTKEMRDKLEELDLRKFCEKDVDSMRDVVEIIAQVGERGRATVTGSETPKKNKESELAKTPRLKTRTGRIPGNDLERTPTPRKRRPVLVLPTTKIESSGSSVDEKDSGWEGSTFGIFSQRSQEDNNQGGVTGANTFSRGADPRSRKAAGMSRSSSRAPSSSASFSPISPSFLARFSTHASSNSDILPAPPPYSEEDEQGETHEEASFKTPRQWEVARRIDITPKTTPVKRLFAERAQQRDAKADHFGDRLLPFKGEDGDGSDQESDSIGRNGSIGVTAEEIYSDKVVKNGGDKDEEEKSQGTWVTEDESGAESRRSIPSLAKGSVLDSGSRKISTSIRAIGLDADGAAYVPLPLSRPTSPVSTPYSKIGNDFSSKSPLPFPPSLLRTMHWATSLPTPPLSPNTQRAQNMHSQSAASNHTTKKIPTRTFKPRKPITVNPSSPVINKKRGLGKGSNAGGSPATPRKVSGKTDLGAEISKDDRNEWISIDSRKLSSRITSERSKFSQTSEDERNQLPLSFATTLVQYEPDEIISNGYSQDIYGNDRGTGSETDNDSDDRTTLYSVSTVSWGEDDPFTAALRLKRQIASKKLREVEQSFSDEIERKRMRAPRASVADRLRWRVLAGDDVDDDSTDSDGGLTDVEEELRVLEEIGRKESIRQGLLLQRLMERGP